MSLSRKTLYGWLLAASSAGVLWLFLNMKLKWDHTTLCFIKNTTGYPCPACGTTRAAHLLLQGHLKEAFLLNPLGYPILLFLCTAPILLIADLLQNKDRFYRFYLWVELQFKKPWIFLPSIILITLNWFWNIYKGN